VRSSFFSVCRKSSKIFRIFGSAFLGSIGLAPERKETTMRQWNSAVRFCIPHPFFSYTIQITIVILLMWSPITNGHFINLEGGALAGQTLFPDDWIIDVQPGQTISGNILMEAFGTRSRLTVIVPFGYT
jgi:hypothetical protein